jgi:hypothetical protein
MLRNWLRALTAIGLAMSAWTAPAGFAPATMPDGPVMSFHNRVLLNRLAVGGHHTAQVMLAVRPGRFQEMLARIANARGQVRRSEPDVDYIRADVPLVRLVDIATDAAVEAYQIASLASPSWYPSAHPQSRAELERNAEVVPVVRASTEPRSKLPVLSPETARGNGYTADEDAGVGRWRAEHPTFDGRGVTIAFLETALVEFGHPAVQVAKAIDGTEVPKIVGVLNTLGPDEADDTRVDLNVHIRTTQTWHAVGNRTYILPRAGAYTFGILWLPVAGELVQRFAVLRNEDTGDVRIDTDSDADLSDEQPLVDVNTRIDVRHLRVSHPRPADLAFVFGAGSRPDRVHFYTARSGHHTMSVSVATGNATPDGLAFGVAPGARALVVRYFASNPQFHTMIEGYLDTARRPDVDILCDSTGIATVPDATGEFAGLFFRRLVARYGKPIFHSAGNARRFLSNVSAVGDVFTVGGALGSATFASLYGGGTLPRATVHPSSAAGPAIDGALKPDFLAPENRISAGIWIDDGHVPLPKNAPTAHLPAGYEISCCTSASSPYAAGLAALILSAAKQAGVPYSVESLGSALRLSAQFLPDWPAHQQGNGVLDVNAAWRALQDVRVTPRIVAMGDATHALTPYVAHRKVGVGLFEQHGWVAGARGRRTLRFRRESGAAAPIKYRISWTGNDGTFAAPPTITLPLHTVSTAQVAIAVRASGAHSAILNLHDPHTDAVVFRTQATVIATEPFDAKTHATRFAGSIPLMHGRELFIRVPESTAAMSVELEVLQGSLGATLLTPDGLYRSYFDHVQPLSGRTFTKGRYSFVWPVPAAGTWSINLGNVSATQERNPALVSTESATYAITVRLLGASLDLRRASSMDIEATMTNRLGALREPILEVSRGTLRSHNGTALPTGLPNTFEINVPNGASTLRVNLRATSSDEPSLELYLYDCTSGECFLWDFTLPAVREHTTVVRSPLPGRWVAAVNAAPYPTKAVQFSLEEIIAGSATRYQAANLASAASPRWSITVKNAHQVPPTGAELGEILLFELFDAAAAREAVTYPWENRKGLFSLADRLVAVGAAVWRIN